MIRSAHRIMIIFLFLLFYSTASSGSSSSVGESIVRCKEVERQALLKIKENLHRYDNNSILPSWGKEEAKRECCKWIGIRCNNKSGHVIMLDLSPATFNTDDYRVSEGNMSSSLVHLRYLNYLDLSHIDLSGNSIPSFIGNLSKLRYLNLSHTSLNGQIPPQLGNLSSLQFLDLSSNGISMENLGWASHLSSLQVLDLSGARMTTAYDWVQVVNNLPHLTDLPLRGCDLPNVVPPSLSLVNASKVLTVLDLAQNPLSVSIFQWLFNYSRSLVHLDLSYCQINTSIPRAFENMASLESLFLNVNLLGGSIPNSFGNISTLKELVLIDNNLEGSIPESFGNMTTLEHLNLGYNMLEAEIPKSIWEICTLQSLQADQNNLSGHLHFAESSSRCAHFSLEELDLSSNQITGSLPNFTLYPSLTYLMLDSNRFNGNPSTSMGQLSKLVSLDISESSLNGVMSEAHFSKLSSLKVLDLSYNPGLVLEIPSHWIPPFQLEYISLGFCKLGPHFPKWLQTQKNIHDLDISNSKISDSIPDGFWNASIDIGFMNLSNNQISGTIPDCHSWLEKFRVLDLSSNQFEGSIPFFLFQAAYLDLSDNKFTNLGSICDATGDALAVLDISYNQLDGKLPDCWFHFNRLVVLILNNNKLSGKIPKSLFCLGILNLGNNNFTGNLPSSLSNCNIDLVDLDIGGNRLEGPIPKWTGFLENLVILNFRSNHFNGSLPSRLCHLAHIQLLDLSVNNISGSIPNCVGNLTGMQKMETFAQNDTGISVGWEPRATMNAQVTIIWKGQLAQYKSTLGLLKSIDLSHNNLVGEIPGEITKLDGLVALNLSRNNLSGEIPAEIGQLKSLDVLDLSRNHLSGKIPSSLSELDFLNTLNISINNLSGKIPTSTQLQSFDPAVYMGNPELCGLPLMKNCPREEATTTVDRDDPDTFMSRGFYVCAGLGFMVGFWGFCGTLLFIKSWRYSYFKFLNGTGDWLYVMIAVHKLLQIGEHTWIPKVSFLAIL